MARVLIAYYSRTGTTKRVAMELAQTLHADVAEIRSVKKRGGALGYVRSAVEAMLETGAGIERVEIDPAGYDVVVIGSPVWFGSLSSPVRAFVWQNRDKVKDVAFYFTMGGRGGERALAQAVRECGRDPRATLIVREGDVVRGAGWSKVGEFADRVRAVVDAKRSDGGEVDARARNPMA